jgi:putative tryptophan/tyrosine transport system substrate-binding protein
VKVGNSREAIDASQFLGAQPMQRKFLTQLLATLFLATIAAAQAQQPAKIPRIGFVTSAGDQNNPGPRVQAFQRGLRELGYVEGKNILVEYRYIEGRAENVTKFVAELVSHDFDVLVFSSLSVVRAAKQATQSIPIIMIIPDDPVALGLVTSLAHPGGNVTGVTRLTRDLSGKRLEILTEAVPGISRVAVLWGPTTRSSGRSPFQDYEAPSRALKIALQIIEVRPPKPDLDGAFRDAIKGRAQALVTVTTSVLVPNDKKIAALAIRHRLPTLFEASHYVEAGGLMSYSADDPGSFKRAATYVDKILKGAKPGDIPVEQPTKFEFVVNLKTAKQIGLTIPPNVRVRADKVIR